MKKTYLIAALLIFPALLTLLLLPMPASADHDGGHSPYEWNRVSVRGAFVLPPVFTFAFLAPPPGIGIAVPWRDHDRHDGWERDRHGMNHRRWDRHRHDHHDRDFDGHGWWRR